jgi:gamma-glutamyltranspeptidase/glutathione hydrolase
MLLMRQFAVSAVLGVVEPYGSGFGGGGFWLLYEHDKHRYVVIDGRERAPLNAHADMYLDAAGQVIPNLSLNGPLAAAIPGMPAAITYINQHYASRSLANNLAPAIHWAEQGFAVNAIYRKYAEMRLATLQRYPATSKIFLRNNQVPALGEKIIQTDLAESIRSIAKLDHAGFYTGKLAQHMAQQVHQHGGKWELRDLAYYTITEHKPLVTEYQGYQVIMPPPPSSGGVAIITMLNMLQQFDLSALNPITRKTCIN